MPNDAIPLDWIKHYIDQLLEFAKKAGPNSKMGAAAMVRADHAMDLVQAWKDKS